MLIANTERNMQNFPQKIVKQGEKKEISNLRRLLAKRTAQRTNYKSEMIKSSKNSVLITCSFSIIFISFLSLRVIQHPLEIKIATCDDKQWEKLIERFFFYSIEWSLIQTHRKYREHFNIRVSTTDNMIRFERTGPVLDLPEIGLRHTVRTDAAMEAVRQSILENSSFSTLYCSFQLGIVILSLRKILNLDLKNFPYKIQMVQIYYPNILMYLSKLFRFISFSLSVATVYTNLIINILTEDRMCSSETRKTIEIATNVFQKLKKSNMKQKDIFSKKEKSTKHLCNINPRIWQRMFSQSPHRCRRDLKQ